MSTVAPRAALQEVSNRTLQTRVPSKNGPITRSQRAALQQNVPRVEPQDSSKVTTRSHREVQPLEDCTEVLAEEIGNINFDDEPEVVEEDCGFDEPECVYLREIMRHLKNTEAGRMPSPTYMEHVQTDATVSMRATLVDWLVYVHRKFKLLLPVLPLAINILDRFLSQRPVSKDKLQLVGGTALLIASKFEEIYPPEIEDFVYASDYIFTKNDVIKMERTILNTLKFEISVPTTYSFLSHFLRVVDADERTTQLARMICDATLVNYGMLQYVPSMIAAGALRMAQMMSRRGSWSNKLHQQTGYAERQLVPCMTDLHAAVGKALAEGAKLNAVREKYSRPEFGNVASIPLGQLSSIQQLGR